MGRECGGQGGREEEVLELACCRLVHSVLGRNTTDPAKGAGDPLGVPGVVHGSGVGEEFPLPADRGLDEAGHERADGTDCHEQETDDDQGESDGRARVLFPSSGVQEYGSEESEADPTDEPDGHDAEDHPGDADVQSHVAMDDVAELVGHDPLELVPRKLGHTTGGDSDHCVVHGESRGECIDRLIAETLPYKLAY